jgi:Rrf2 family transcriptional regulator, iron-sulfur cluster assembly transcription factor
VRLTTKGRFAVTAMIDLALRSGKGPVALAAISQRQQISLSYLEQLFGKLRRQQLVESTRGPGGGYALAREAAQISVADIIVAVDEAIDATGCGGAEECMGEGSGKCMTHDLWSNLNTKMLDYLSSIKLQSLVDEQHAKGHTVDGVPVKRAISNVPVVKPIRITAPNSVFALGGAFSVLNKQSS